MQAETAPLVTLVLCWGSRTSWVRFVSRAMTAPLALPATNRWRPESTIAFVPLTGSSTATLENVSTAQTVLGISTAPTMSATTMVVNWRPVNGPQVLIMVPPSEGHDGPPPSLRSLRLVPTSHQEIPPTAPYPAGQDPTSVTPLRWAPSSNEGRRELRPVDRS